MAVSKKKSQKEKVADKREKQIAETFKALNLVASTPYTDANSFSRSFQKVSIYDQENYFYSISNSSVG